MSESPELVNAIDRLTQAVEAKPLTDPENVDVIVDELTMIRESLHGINESLDLIAKNYLADQ